MPEPRRRTLVEAEPAAVAHEVEPVEALADELVATGIRLFLEVPGHPVTRLLEALERRVCRVLDAANEKTAAEMAIGASLAGTPVALLFKGNGALLAAEPLQNAGPHGIGAPLLLVVGDDVLAERSTVPTDARPLGPMLDLPVLDLPSGPLLRPTVSAAVEASRSSSRPVLVRFTGSLLTSGSDSHPPVARLATAAPDRRISDRSAVTKLSRALDFSVTRRSELDDVASAAPMWEEGRDRESGGSASSPRRGILAVGGCAAMLGPEAADRPVLALTCAWPLTRRAVEFCRELDEVLVLEEGSPFVEDELQRMLGRAGVACRVLGQRSGSVPAVGSTSPEVVARAVIGEPAPTPVLEPRAPEHAVEAHEYRRLFLALAEVHAATGVPVHSCVGSCISVAYPPYSMAASALNLGGSTGVAAGAALADGRACIALIGDYGLIHSGLDAFDQIQRRHLPVLTIVLANGRSAKTGGQPSAASASHGGADPFDIPAQLHRSTTRPDRVQVVRIEEASVKELTDRITRLLTDVPSTLVVVAGNDVAGCRDVAGRKDA